MRLSHNSLPDGFCQKSLLRCYCLLAHFICECLHDYSNKAGKRAKEEGENYAILLGCLWIWPDVKLVNLVNPALTLIRKVLQTLEFQPCILINHGWATNSSLKSHLWIKSARKHHVSTYFCEMETMHFVHAIWSVLMSVKQNKTLK